MNFKIIFTIVVFFTVFFIPDIFAEEYITCNNNSDDHQIIQNAVNNNSVIYLTGICDINGTVYVGDNVSMIYGDAELIQKQNTSSNEGLLKIISDNIVVKGLTINGNRDNQDDITQFGLLFSGKNAELSNLEFKKIRDHNIALRGADNVLIDKITVMDSWSRAVDIDRNTHNTNNIIIKNSVFGFDKNTPRISHQHIKIENGDNPQPAKTENFIIKNNIFYGTGKGSGIGESGITLLDNAKGVIIANNIFRDFSMHSIAINKGGEIGSHQVTDVIIENNMIDGCNNGIMLSTTSEISINNNIISNCVFGIKISDLTSDILIFGNNIKNNNVGINSGIDAVTKNSGNYNIKISDNTIHNNKKFGIYLKLTVGSLIQDNLISNNGDSGIFLVTISNQNIIKDNVIKNNGINNSSKYHNCIRFENNISDTVIKSNFCYDDQPLKTQISSISICMDFESNCTNNIITDNILYSYGTNAVLQDGGINTTYNNNLEFSEQIGSYTVGVIGDYGNGRPNGGEFHVSESLKNHNPDFILTVGDNNYPDGGADTIDDNVGQFYSDFIKNYHGNYGLGSTKQKFFPSLGNHDLDTGNGEPYYDYFDLPGNERYYDFVIGNTHFFVLNSDPIEPDGVNINSVQYNWFAERLNDSDSKFHIVYFHHPPYSSGRHGSVQYMQWGFDSMGIDAVISGHDHVYERLDINGIPYFVNGLGGHGIYEFNELLPQSVFSFNETNGYMTINITDDMLDFGFYDYLGTLLDNYVIDYDDSE